MAHFNSNKKFEKTVAYLNELIEHSKPNTFDHELPLLLKLGSSRSGSTIFTQWAASLQLFSYPSNFLSLFYKNPAFGAIIYEILTNPDYKYNNEFSDISNIIDFESISGKTNGIKSPNEFWPFWKHNFNFPEKPIDEDIFVKQVDFDAFNKEISRLHSIFNKPFLLKGHCLNYYLKSFSNNLDNAIYIHMYRNPIHVISSVLKARILRWDDINYWFGWKPKEFDQIKDMDVFHQVAGQVYFNEKAILNSRISLGSRYISFSYEEFCKSPEAVYNMLIKTVNKYNKKYTISTPYKGPLDFKTSKPMQNSELDEIINAWHYFTEKYGPLSYD